MKAKFVKDVVVDVLTDEEIYHKSFRKGDVIDIAPGGKDLVSLGSQFTNISLPNGDILLDVPINSVIFVG